jgi:hypothetical protein
MNMKVKGLIAGMMIVGGTFLFAQEGTAYIREISGTVEVKNAGAAEWRAARSGEEVGKDTVISTGFKSTAVISLGNSTLMVRPLTRLSVEEIATNQGEESVNLYLRTGRVRAEVNPPPGSKTEFTIRSPSATASVRGTSFEFNGEHLIVNEGRVHITGGDGSGVYVGAGHQVYSDPETGRTPVTGETVRSELTPALTSTAAERTPKAAEITPATVDAEFGLEWN